MLAFATKFMSIKTKTANMETAEKPFEYELMNTTLSLLMPGCEPRVARTAAYESYCMLELLENTISMYRPGSDIAMLNEIPRGESVKISQQTFDCLLAAFRAAEASGGAVDVCMGEFFLKAKNDKTLPKIETPRRGKFAFDDENYIVQKLEDGMIDLGGIGKGFGVELVADKLTDEWNIKNALVNFGGSSIFAIGRDAQNNPWRINLSDTVSVPLDNAFVSASGTSVLGSHIIDCRTGEIPPSMPFRTWAFSGEGALSDAMSTAFMILSRDEIKSACAKYNLTAALQQTPDAPIIFID